MFQNLGNFFRWTKQNQETRNIPPISQEEKFQINMFSQNLDAFSTISRDSTCGPLFSRLVNQFSATFKNITPDHLNIEEIKLILERYCQLCSELGILSLHDKSNLAETLFNSLTFTSSLFGYIPRSESYFSFFCAVIQEIKKSPTLFGKSIQFLTCLFKSTGFFTEFLANDGFSLIFSSFFIQENVDSHQENLLRLLFKTVSMEHYKNAKMKSKEPNLKFFIDLLSHQIGAKYSFKNSCLFISYYIIAFLPSCQTIISTFNSYNGFKLLNNLFIHNCPEIAHECYEIMMIETDLDQIVLSNMNQLFLNPETGTKLRSSLIPLLSVQTNSINNTYQKLSATIPLTKYLLRPPELDKTGLNTLSQIISSFINNSSLHVDFNQFLIPILNLIKFPVNEEIPCDSYFDILIDALNSKKITCETLIKEKFLSLFLLEQKSEEIASYYQHNKVGLQLFLSIYVSDSINSETKCTILQKFLQSTQYLTDKTFYIEFLLSLLSFQFSSKIYRLLLMFIKDQSIMTLLIKETKQHSSSFDFFIENGGFLFLDNFIEDLKQAEIKDKINEDENNAKYLNAMKLCSALAFFSPHQEIDEWLNKQPVDSKLFSCCSNDFLSQMAFGFKPTCNRLFVPSLLPFVSDFDSSSPYNLFLAGKFGLQACIKRQIPFEKVPHISEIVNRYVSSSVMKLLFNQKPNYIKNYIDPSMPHFSVFEFIPSAEPSYLVYKQQYSSLSFWYYTPVYKNEDSTGKTRKNSIFKSKFQLVSCHITTLEIIDNDSLIAKTNRDKLQIASSAGKWHHVVIIFHMKRNIAYKCEIIIDKKHAGFLKVELQTIPNHATFGNKKSTIPAPLLISSNVFLYESMITEEQINLIYKEHLSDFISSPSRCCYTSKSDSSVVYVNYLGFASYFSSSTNIEKLFALLEKVGTTKVTFEESYNELNEQFSSVFQALLNLQTVNRSKFRTFWGRMILSFCRCKDLIEDNLHYYACDLLDSFCESSMFFISAPKSKSSKITKALFLILSIIEIYSVFSYESLKQFFAHILELQNIDWKMLEMLKITDYLMTALRSGIDDNIKLLFVPLLSKTTQVDPTILKLRSFFNSVISIGDWTYNVVDLIHDNVTYSVVQHKLLSVFVNSAKLLQDPSEIFTLNQILMFMMLFLDERAICLAELIAVCSYRNPKFIATPNSLLSYVFSALAIENNKIWKIAFSILSGNMPRQKYIRGFQIKRPNFVSVVLDMLNALAANCAYKIFEKTIFDKQNENKTEQQNQKENENDSLSSDLFLTMPFTLFSKVINVLLSLDKTQFHLFSQQQCTQILHSLLFLGITPNSYSADEKSERTMKIWSTFSLQPPTKVEIKQIISLTTQSSLFSPIVLENLCYEPKAISSSSKYIYYFPNDIDDSKDYNDESKKNDDCIFLLIELMKSSLLLDLFVSIIMESENISSLFLDLVSGNALMYNKYNKMIAQELVLAVLSRFSSTYYFISSGYFNMVAIINNNGLIGSLATTTFNSSIFLSLLKNIMLAVHKTAITGVFNDKYLIFLSAVLQVLSQPSEPQSASPVSTIAQQLPSAPSSPSEKGRKKIINQGLQSDNVDDNKNSSSSSAPTTGLSYIYTSLPNTNSSSPPILSAITSILPSVPSPSSSAYIIDLLLSDDKFLKMYKDILLSAFCYISEGDSNPLFQLLLHYKETVFKHAVFSDNKFSSLWLHVTRHRGGNSPERIECMESFMLIIDNSIMSAYSPIGLQAEWISFKTSKNGKWMNNYFESVMNENEHKASRISRMNAIIEWKQKCYTIAAKFELFSRIYRSCNFSVEQNMVIQEINASQRTNERLVFMFSLLARKREMQSEEFVPASYHLSPLSFPVCQSRTLSPSPFSIKSPSLTSKVPRSFFIPFDDYDYYDENDDEDDLKSSKKPKENTENDKKDEKTATEISKKDESDTDNNKETNDEIATTTNNETKLDENETENTKNSDDKDADSTPQTTSKRKRRRRHHESQQRIKAINQRGLMNCSPEWSFFGHSEGHRPFYSPFEYSAVIEQGPESLLKLFETAFQEYGPFTQRYDVNFFYFIHPLPSVLFITNTAILLVVLAKGELQLISHPQNPVAFLPFTESVALGEFSQTSLFCGHVVIITRIDVIVRIQRHFYVHKKVGLCISTIGASNLILLFQNHAEMTAASKLIGKKVFRRSYPPSHLLFTVQTLQQSTFLWQNNVISNFDYLMLLNAFGGRSFADLAQYPVVPWVVSPSTLEKRDLSLPMGQLSENRAKHYDQTYELSSPLNYYYGFHYSLPGIVFWFLMRLPPFTFFQWDLNNGWDNSRRLFVSIADAWNSAAVSNPSDLKELIPAIYQTPEALLNTSNIELSVPDNVTLPEWSKNNPYYFSENEMKHLNESQKIHLWINLIFGFQQNGEAAIKAKNVFLPSSYHSTKCEDVEMDEDAFKSQVLNFGQCPVQLFNEPHPAKMFKAVKKNWNDVIFDIFDLNSVEVLNPLQLQMKNHLYSAVWISGKSVGKQVVLLLPLTMMKKKLIELSKQTKKHRNERQRRLLKQETKTSINDLYLLSLSSTAMIKMECSGTYYYFDVDHEMESLSLFTDCLSNGQNESNNLVTLSSSSSSTVSLNSTMQPSDIRQSRGRFKTTMAKSPSFSFIDNLNMKSSDSVVSKEYTEKPGSSRPQIPRPKKGEEQSLLTTFGSSQTMLQNNHEKRIHGTKEESLLNNGDDQVNNNSIEEKSMVLLTRKPVFVKYSYDFAYVNHLSVSDDGFFLVVSFEFGLIDIYKIVFEKGRPSDISRMSSFFEFGSNCKISAVFSQDYLCASVLETENFQSESSITIVIWNFATQMRHRSIKLEKDFVPIQISFDQFDGVLTVLGRTEIRQYSSNAVPLRTFKFESILNAPISSEKDKNTNDKNTNDKNTNDKNTNDKNTNDKNTNDKSTNDKSTNDKSTNDKNTNDKNTNKNNTNENNSGDKNFSDAVNNSSVENDSILICNVNSNHNVSNSKNSVGNNDAKKKRKRSSDLLPPLPVCCTCMALLGLDFSFDSRLTIVGHSDGSITVLAVDQKTFEFKVVKRLGENLIGNSRCGIINILESVTNVPRFTTVDERGVVRVVEISAFDPRTRITQCSFCENPQTTVCVKCQSPLCDSCRHEGTDFCMNCARGSEILNFGHF